MDWNERYPKSSKPTMEQIGEYICNSLWEALNDFLKQTYHVKPQIEYSGCSMQMGWNIKYRKRGKSLCTLYPEQGSFKALVIANERNQVELDLYISTCSDYMKELYESVKFFHGGKWLMIEVYNAVILEETKGLIGYRCE